MKFLAPFGLLIDLVQSRDWSNHALGNPDNWPLSLKMPLSQIAYAQLPMLIFWGEKYHCFYNEAYQQRLGIKGKHPQSFGKPAHEIWPETWHFTMPVVDKVINECRAILMEQQVQPVNISGKIENVYWNFHYSPLLDEKGAVKGVLLTCQETTREVQLSQTLRQSDEKYRALIENSLYCFLLARPDGTILDANKAAEEVFGYSIEEIKELGRKGIIDSADPELAKHLAAREKEGRASGELTGIRKNGERFPCEFSSVVFFDKSGEKRTSTVLIDISERKRIEKEKALLINNTEESFVLLDMNLNIVNFNKQFGERYKLLFGKEVKLGESIVNYAQPGREEAVKAIYEKVLAGETVELEIEVSSPLGKLTYSNTYKPAYGENGHLFGAFVTSRDITKTKQAQQALLQSEEKFRSIVEHTLTPVLLIDADNGGQILEVNQATQDMLGYTSSEFLAMRVEDLFENLTLDIIKVANKGEIKGLRKNGIAFYCHFSSATFKDKGAQNRITLTLLDITERKEAEKKINKANRLYSFISAINQTIIHATDQENLFKEVCRIACELGGFKMAWVGRLDNKTKGVITLESYGDGENYLKNVKITSKEDEGLGLGPTGIAARDNITNVCADIATDPRMTPWREEALKRGFKSSIALPIKRKEASAKGVFTLYASEAHFFDYEEVSLLEEVAIDIAFALENFEKERLHHHAEQQLIINERRYRALVENGADVVVILTPEGKPTYVSPSITKVLGYTDQEAMQLDLFSMLHPDDIEGLTKVWNVVLASKGEAINGHTGRMRHKNGSWRWLEATVTNLCHDPIIGGIVDNFRDVTDKIVIEKEREFERRDKEALINGTDDLIWSVNRDFTLMAANRAFIQTLHKSTGILLKAGDNLLLKEYFDKDFLDFWQDLYDKGLAGALSRTELHTPASDKQPESWADVSFTPIYEDEKIIGLACHSRDITKRKKREQEKQLVFEIINALQTKESVEKSLTEVIRMLGQYLGFVAGEAWFVNDNLEKLNLRANWVNEKRLEPFIHHEKKEFALNEGLPGITCQSKEIVFWNDLKNHSQFVRRAILSELPFTTAIGLPIIMDGEVIAVFTFFGEKPIHNQEELVSISNWVAVQIALNIHSKQAEEALLLSNIRFRTIFQEAPVGIALLDPSSGDYDVNPMFAKIVGRTANELTNQNWKDYTHPDDLGADLENMAKLESGEQDSFSLEKRYLRHDNSLVWVNMTITTIKTDGQKKPLHLCMIEDITEQKSAKEEILANRELLRMAESISHVGSWDLYFESGESNWSDEFFRICGFEPQSFVPTAEMGIQIIHPDDRKHASYALKRAIAESESYNIEKRILRPNGEVRVVLSTGSIQKDIHGKPYRLVGTFQDITEKKNAEMALALSEESYRSLFERNPDAVFSFNFKGKFISANQSLVKMVGSTLEELYQSTFETFIAPEDKERVLSLFQKAIKGETQNYDCDIVTKAGDRLTLNVTKLPIVVQGKIIGVYGIAKDITHQKLAEMALKESEEKYKLLFDNSPLPKIIYDLETFQIFEVNQSAVNAYGYSREEFLTMSTKDIRPKKELNKLIEAHQNIFDKGVHNYGHWTHKRKNGEEFTVDVFGHKIEYKGHPAMIAAYHDITERLKAEEAAMSTLVEKNTILESIGDAFFAVDADWNVLYWNKMAEKVLQTPKEVILGKHLWTVFAQSIDSDSYRNYHKAVETKTPIHFQDYFAPLDKWYEISAYPSRSGLSVYFKDITDRMFADIKLKQSHELLIKLTDKVPLAIYQFEMKPNGEMRFPFMSKGAASVGIDREPDEITSTPVKTFDSVHPDDLDRMMESIKVSYTNLSDWELEYRTREIDGNYKWVRGSSKPEKLADGTVVWYGYLQDITYLKINEQMLRELNAELLNQAKELASSNQELERFAYVASHDLQEPLRMVGSFLQLLKKKYDDKLDSQAQEYIHYAVDGAERMKQLILDLLEYSRAGSREQAKELVNLNELLPEVLRMLQQSIDENQAKIEVGNLPSIKSVPSQMIQLFQNIIGNAIKYRTPNITPHVSIQATEEERHWRIEISDNGMGIDERFREKVFVIFQRLHNRKDYKGTGIGLAICKKIVERHGGKIFVNANQQQGSIFTFTIKK